ncbi:MAG: hypothetical protein HN559_15710, partial [Gemmatimonadetes bacterium]|nr:hypothetical protein [Gemmatimonadota bacterium]
AKIAEAAELYSVTEIEGFCRELEKMDEPQQRLARRLRDMSQQQDMDGILTLMEQTKTHV